jgi:hypothetical protein
MNLTIYKRFIFWWVSVLLVGTSIFWANYFGLVNTIWTSDTTKITSIILVLYTFTNVALGWLAWKASDPIFMSVKRNILEKITDYSWFMSEMLMALGMFGTVVGLIHMLETSSISNVQDTNAVQGMLSGMWKAMGLALYTNAVGLLFSIILKFQVYFIGVENET